MGFFPLKNSLGKIRRWRQDSENDKCGEESIKATVQISVNRKGILKI